MGIYNKRAVAASRDSVVRDWRRRESEPFASRVRELEEKVVDAPLGLSCYGVDPVAALVSYDGTRGLADSMADLLLDDALDPYDARLARLLLRGSLAFLLDWCPRSDLTVKGLETILQMLADDPHVLEALASEIWSGYGWRNGSFSSVPRRNNTTGAMPGAAHRRGHRLCQGCDPDEDESLRWFAAFFGTAGDHAQDVGRAVLREVRRWARWNGIA